MKDADNTADLEAMQRLRGGDARALDELMERWAPRVASFLTRQTGNASDAMDLTQECFVVVWRSREKFRATATFSTWLFGIAANLARQKRRWHRRHPEVALDPRHDETGDNSPAEDAVRAERSRAVRKAVLQLPAKLREVLVLAEYEDLSHPQIAAIVRCSPKAVESRLARAREKLRGLLLACA